MDNTPLDIHDSDRSTRGGPPGWLAFSVILAAAVLIALIAIGLGVLL